MMKLSWARGAAAILGVALMAALAPTPAASAAKGDTGCKSISPVDEFYEAGRVGSFRMTVPTSACSTISVSHIKDTANPKDRCQTFLLQVFSEDGSEWTYTDTVRACSVRPNSRTVLATNVPDGTVYRILYEIDYLGQHLRYKAWH